MSLPKTGKKYKKRRRHMNKALCSFKTLFPLIYMQRPIFLKILAMKDMRLNQIPPKSSLLASPQEGQNETGACGRHQAYNSNMSSANGSTPVPGIFPIVLQITQSLWNPSSAAAAQMCAENWDGSREGRLVHKDNLSKPS